MRVIAITNRFGDIGTHPQLTRLAFHLKGAGHEVQAVSLAPPGTIVETFKEAGIGTDVINASRRGSFLPVVGKLTTTFRRVRPDAVVAFLYEAIMPTRLAARVAGVPAIISSIRNEYFGPRYRELLLRSTERLSAETVVNSKKVAQSLVRRGVVSQRQIVVIPNGVDVSLFDPSQGAREVTRSSLGVTDAEFMWLTVGRLAEQKAYPNLFQALSLVVESMPRSKLFVAGRGPLHDELRLLADRSGLQGNVSFIGFRDDIPSILAAADAFVMASRYEGMPNALMEALASGLPAVGTDVGGIPELIRDGVTGYLVPPSQPRALASAMARLAQAPAHERIEMGERGRSLVRDLFDIEQVMESWAELIEDAVARSQLR
jgi:glycosyltransferase involved in cell wall biosynthesis